MDELASYARQLPDTLEDLSKFVLLGREKIICIRAEIRAIDKVNLAREVRDQKREEAAMLSEVVLDAEVRLGDLLKQIPKDVGGRPPKEKTTDTAVHGFTRPKKEIIRDLGFSEKQAQRFEALADNKDLVDQVKQEARESGEPVTRGKVLDLAQQRKKKEVEEQEKKDDYYSHIDECAKVAQAYNKAIFAFTKVNADEKEFKMVSEIMLEIQRDSYLSAIENSIGKLLRIQNFLKKGVKK